MTISDLNNAETSATNLNAPPRLLLVMGVSGAGKTSTGRRIAAGLGWQFKDADDFHSAENKTKMHQGIPLDDDDRQPWLQLLAKYIHTWLSADEPTVLACFSSQSQL